MSNSFKNRVFGCAIIKSINSNYNADFTHQPRTLPDGTIYATDKALKYTVRNYWVKNGERVFFFKRLNDNFNPYDLNEAYERMFVEDKNGKNKEVTLKNLLSCLDIKTFGATYANKKKELSLSIHAQYNLPME
jgi:CRISPR-associated protein Csh2